jgi:chromosome segregation ATPase
MNNDSCPTCSQDITQALKDTRVTTLKEAAKSILKTREEVISDMGENTDLIADMQNTLKEISNTSNEMQRTQALIEQLKTSKLVKKDKVDLTKSYEELKTLITAMDELRDELDLLSERLLYNDTATAMLKDTGIRTKVVREYLPAMNMLINNYLQTLDFFVSFNLDENFNETIRSRHRDTFVYANFSEGEKQRIDLSLLFAWRQIAKMKNSTNTNLLLLDETFDSSLDTDGVDNLMKILYSLDDNTNTFVISHKPDLLESKLKSKIEFKKINNFSMIA